MKRTLKIRSLFALCLLSGLCIGLTEVLFPVFTKELIDFATAGNLHGVIWAAVKVVAAGLTASITGFGPAYFQRLYANELKTQMRMGMANQILQTPLTQLDAAKKASFLTIYNSDIHSVITRYYLNTADIWQHVFTIIFSISALFTLHAGIAAFIVIVNAVKVCITFFFKKPYALRYRRSIEAGRALTATLSDFLNGIHVVRTNRLGSAFLKEIREKSDRNNAADLHYEKLDILSGFLGLILTHGVKWGILFYGGYLILRGQYSAGMLLSTMQIAEVLSFPTLEISYLINDRNGAKPLKEELEHLMCAPKPDDVDPVFHSTPTLKLDHVSFTAGSQTILKNISFEFEPFKKYLILGESGCGKSTLLKLIGGVESDYTGQITVGGISQKALGDRLYGVVRIVFQESYLFQKSITDNISQTGENKACFEHLIHTLRLAGVLEKYKDTVLDEKSAQTLSGGEKQRIAIARAFYAQPKILLLDEVTSALDKETSLEVEKMLLEYPGTVIFVSHVPNQELLDRYDYILTMEEGEIRSITTLAQRRKNLDSTQPSIRKMSEREGRRLK